MKRGAPIRTLLPGNISGRRSATKPIPAGPTYPICLWRLSSRSSAVAVEAIMLRCPLPTPSNEIPPQVTISSPTASRSAADQSRLTVPPSPSEPVETCDRLTGKEHFVHAPVLLSQTPYRLLAARSRNSIVSDES